MVLGKGIRACGPCEGHPLGDGGRDGPSGKVLRTPVSQGNHPVVIYVFPSADIRLNVFTSAGEEKLDVQGAAAFRSGRSYLGPSLPE